MTNPPAISALDAAAAEFRAALLRRDEAALKRLMAAYGPVYARVQADVARLTAQIAAARAAGTTVRPSWLLEKGRLETLQRQVVAEWARYAETASAVITDTQRQAVAAATQEAHALIVAALDDAGVAAVADVARLHPAAVADLIGALGDGSPLKTLLDTLGQQAARDVAAALTHAVAVGRSPRQTAREIRGALGGDLNRALTIARTEHLRAYRGASLRSYQENSDILRGWQWRASPSRRTCPVCLAMDGTEHPLDEAFGSHVNCRCTPIPLLRDRPTPARETGEEWFARQPAAVQREMLGPGKYALYQQGQIGLADLVGVTHDPQWGTVRYQRSIRELRAKPPEAS
jgi:SPP1 gp7 family putative phage head morphogenesis protein